MIILLAAGRGLRMGGPNKLLLPFAGKTVLETTLDRLCAAAPGPVCVVTGHARADLLPILQQFPVQEVFNPDYAQGMTGSIQAGIRALPPDAPGYMICLADMPLIAPDTYRRLLTYFHQHLEAQPDLVVLPRFQGQKGNPVCFAGTYRPALLAHTDPEGCRSLVQAHAAKVHWVDVPDAGILQDLDTEADYRQQLPPVKG